MDYLTVIKDLYQRLRPFQITQEKIIPKVEDHQIIFQLDHPTEGLLDIKMDLPLEKRFLCHGIGLEFEDDQDLKDPLILVYDFGGIFDSIDGYVPGDHYATTHFALLGAVLYKETEEGAYIDDLKRAMEFHIRTSKDEYHFAKWGYHWDFQNVAFIETYHIVKDVLSCEEEKKWRNAILSWRENTTNPLTNWLAMRAYTAFWRFREFKRFPDLFRYLFRILMCVRARHFDGCFDDFRNRSRPLQYHVFTLAILHRLYTVHQSRIIRRLFLSGIQYFLPFIDPEGSFNYLGRGQEQIFGYAAAIYVLEAAKRVDPKNWMSYHHSLTRIRDYLLKFRKNGIFPLVLNTHKDDEKYGWYDYHHFTVYEAFLGAWLGLTYQLCKSSTRENQDSVFKECEYIKYFKSTRICIVSKLNYFAAFSGGSPDYLSEPSITPLHLWFRHIGWVFSCPGGPSPHLYGKINRVQHIEKNFFSPIALDLQGNWLVPSGGISHKFTVKNQELTIQFDYGLFRLLRNVKFEEQGLVMEDVFTFLKDGALEEIRFFNFPAPLEICQLEIDSDRIVRLTASNGLVQIHIKEHDFCKSSVEVLEEIKTAKGLVTLLALREKNVKVKKGMEKRIRFSVESKTLKT